MHPWKGTTMLPGAFTPTRGRAVPPASMATAQSLCIPSPQASFHPPALPLMSLPYSTPTQDHSGAPSEIPI